MKMTKSRDDVLEILCKQLRQLALDENLQLTREQAAKITLESLGLDSLATLQLALGLEDALNMEIEVVDLPRDHTILQLADYLRSK
jgi:acyl carrier protein